MKTDDIIQSIKNDTFADKEIISSEIKDYEIMNIPDMSVLRGIAKYRDKFEVLRQTETWSNNGVRQLVLGSMDKFITFLKYIDNGACRCIKYQYIKPDPEKAESLGLVNLLVKVQHERPFEASYECKCTICRTIFICHSGEERFGIGYSWRRKIS